MRLIDKDDIKHYSKVYDAIVIGSGAAGLFCATKLSHVGLNVCILTKDSADTSSTKLAQGGIAVALPVNDSPSCHYNDTIKAGAGLVDRKTALILVEEGVKRVIDLIRMGATFEMDELGLLKFTKEAAHSVPRIVYYKDKTGEEVERSLLDTYRGDIVEHAFVKELIVKNGRCYGVVFENNGNNFAIYAPVVAIATGGAAGLYEKHTNPETSTGDGIAIALRYGAVLKDLEFVQFHPTAFVNEGRSFLISESVRGEGAVIVDSYGRRFMGDYHPLWELAPRDVVTRAIENQKKITGGKIFLDFRPIEKEGIDINERFPTITQKLNEVGIDAKMDLVPISPVAHYYLGGIAVDTFGRTNIKGLFAIGEASCTGVHGANRLASNSLLECLVFGERTAYGMYRDLRILSLNFKKVSFKKIPCFPYEKGNDVFTSDDLRKVMWKYLGIMRDGSGLTKAIDVFRQMIISSSSFEVRNSAVLSLAIAISAMRREESRGGHFRRDYPYEREEFKFHSSFILRDLLNSI